MNLIKSVRLCMQSMWVAFCSQWIFCGAVLHAAGVRVWKEQTIKSSRAYREWVLRLSNTIGPACILLIQVLRRFLLEFCCLLRGDLRDCVLICLHHELVYITMLWRGCPLLRLDTSTNPSSRKSLPGMSALRNWSLEGVFDSRLVYRMRR